jgi:hypothetical protein
MNPFETLRHAFRSGGSGSDQHFSMVLLEDHHHFMRKEKLQTAAEKAFGHAFGAGHPGYAVHQSASTFIEADGYVIQVTQSSSPYHGHPHEIETRKGDRSLLHHAWKDHKGFVAFDLRGTDHTRVQAYRVLSALMLELLDSHVLGVLLPRENDLYPNDGSAAEQMAHLKGL